MHPAQPSRMTSFTPTSCCLSTQRESLRASPVSASVGTAPTEAAVAGSTDGAAASAVLPTKKRAVSLRHLKFDDLSRHRIEEHYEKSHPKQWASHNRAVSQTGGARARLSTPSLQQKGLQGILSPGPVGGRQGCLKSRRGRFCKAISRGTRCSGTRSYLCDRRVETGRPTRGV
jgi:hypothetical protein